MQPRQRAQQATRAGGRQSPSLDPCGEFQRMVATPYRDRQGQQGATGDVANPWNRQQAGRCGQHDEPAGKNSPPLPGEPTQCHFTAQSAGLQAEHLRNVHRASVSRFHDRLMWDRTPHRSQVRQFMPVRRSGAIHSRVAAPDPESQHLLDGTGPKGDAVSEGCSLQRPQHARALAVG